jgi:hypothetical protein
MGIRSGGAVGAPQKDINSSERVFAFCFRTKRTFTRAARTVFANVVKLIIARHEATSKQRSSPEMHYFDTPG